MAYRFGCFLREAKGPFPDTIIRRPLAFRVPKKDGKKGLRVLGFRV